MNTQSTSFLGVFLQQKKKKKMPNRGSLFFTAMLYLPTILHFLRGHFRLMIKPEEIGKDIQALSFTIALNNALLSTTTPTKNKKKKKKKKKKILIFFF